MLVPFIWRIRIKHAVKIDIVVICACIYYSLLLSSSSYVSYLDLTIFQIFLVLFSRNVLIDV
jgi:hypothetical protein